MTCFNAISHTVLAMLRYLWL